MGQFPVLNSLLFYQHDDGEMIEKIIKSKYLIPFSADLPVGDLLL
jgi:hypothetical protein